MATPNPLGYLDAGIVYPPEEVKQEEDLNNSSKIEKEKQALRDTSLNRESKFDQPIGNTNPAQKTPQPITNFPNSGKRTLTLNNVSKLGKKENII